MNMTPRPVRPARGRPLRVPATVSVPAPGPDPVSPSATAPAPTPKTHPVSSPGPHPVAAAADPGGPEPHHDLFHTSASNGGLGLPAARTWDGLRATAPAGATLEELSAAVGFTPPTIAKHLKALAAFRLAEQRGPRWHPTDAHPTPSGTAAAP
ncbi:hypothetical protein [Streptomyces sp. NPDC093093]|uniref:hypothetical protein n=1 Tax=Streptomyces sp. NPDC093093 TaxID=3366025 RepID=UPI0037F18CA1